MAVQLLVEQLGGREHGTRAPPGAGVADDPQKPGAGVATGERAEVPEGPQRRLLHDILGRVIVPQQPAREPARRVQVRQDDIVEAPGGGLGGRALHTVNLALGWLGENRQNPYRTRTTS